MRLLKHVSLKVGGYSFVFLTNIFGFYLRVWGSRLGGLVWEGLWFGPRNLLYRE